MKKLKNRKKIKKIVIEELAKLDFVGGKIYESFYIADDLGMDSLDNMELIMQFEEHFYDGNSFEEHKLVGLKTVGSIIDFIYHNQK